MRDNSKLYCTPIFYYDKEIPEVVKEMIEPMFLDMRNIAVDMINPHYEEWNEAYTKEVTGADDYEYNSYIASKHREVLKSFNETVNAKNHGNWFMWLDSDNDTADICCKYNDPNSGIVTIHMELKLINEKEWKEYHGITHDIHG